MQPEEVIIEPLALVKTWKLARLVGDDAKIGTLLYALKGLEDHDFFSHILRNWQSNSVKSNKTKLNLLEDHDLKTGGHEFIIQEGNHRLTVLVGSFRELHDRCQFDTYSKELSEEAVEHQATLASRNGYLALGLALATGVTQNVRPKFLGLVLLEPEIDSSVSVIRPTRIYTQADPELSHYLAGKLWDMKAPKTMIAGDLSHRVSVWQKQVKETQVIGNCDALTKHHLVSYWRSQGTTLVKDPFVT